MSVKRSPCGSGAGRYRFNKASICCFSLGKSSLTVVHTIPKSTENYSWIAMLRIPRICAHGISGCCLMKSGAAGDVVHGLADELDVPNNGILNPRVRLKGFEIRYRPK